MCHFISQQIKCFCRKSIHYMAQRCCWNRHRYKSKSPSNNNSIIFWTRKFRWELTITLSLNENRKSGNNDTLNVKVMPLSYIYASLCSSVGAHFHISHPDHPDPIRSDHLHLCHCVPSILIVIHNVALIVVVERMHRIKAFYVCMRDVRRVKQTPRQINYYFVIKIPLSILSFRTIRMFSQWLHPNIFRRTKVENVGQRFCNQLKQKRPKKGHRKSQ